MPAGFGPLAFLGLRHCGPEASAQIHGSLKPITPKHHQSAILNHLNPRVPERISQFNILTTRIKYNSLRLKL